MASYQVPQFLDSGEKILGPMNIRQLGYFLFGFGLCTLLYSIFQSLFVGIGIYASIPTLPVLALFAYLALGKYNGRDSEVYVFKMVIYYTKPRLMKFKRLPDFSDIDSRAKEYTFDKISSKFAVGSMDKSFLSTAVEKSLDFDPNDKIARIKALSRKVDMTQTTVFASARKIDKLNKEREEEINRWKKINKKR